MNDIKLLNKLIELTKIEVENLKRENTRLIKENERLIGIIETLSKKGKEK